MKRITFAFLVAVLPFLAFSQNDISKLDKNFATKTVQGVNVVYHNMLASPFVLEGFAWYNQDKALCRIPLAITEKDISRGVYHLARETAGGVIRFRTNSQVLSVRYTLTLPERNFGHMPATGVSGLDIVIDGFNRNVNPMNGNKLGNPVERLVARNLSAKMKDIEVYLPLYNGIKSIEIGLSANAKIEAPREHKIKKPVVFYGSSITQGGCANKPTHAYTTMLCREVDAPQINLGFSGNAKGEDKMAELIASLDMSVFVYDYDHNAPNATHLKNTHERFFKIIRKAQPNLPIIIMSSVGYPIDPKHWGKREAVIMQTYKNAVKNGDKNVYFVHGKDMTKDVSRFIWTTDNCHPNDYGFYLMYKATLPTLKKALSIE